ncbi:hypothetical protein [Brevundimonas sp.]|uniref:hypothetical protein n=1 Tax=Brevundimonas sp. TaxID=1871086 RepID=UPI00286AAC4A|nr:hypothetical protein [Brevundimonas sp.]
MTSPTPDPRPAAPDLERLLAPLRGLDLTSADGRCGIKSLLAEIERLSPGAILQQAAGIQLRRLGCVTLADHRDRA